MRKRLVPVFAVVFAASLAFAASLVVGVALAADPGCWSSALSSLLFIVSLLVPAPKCAATALCR